MRLQTCCLYTLAGLLAGIAVAESASAQSRNNNSNASQLATLNSLFNSASEGGGGSSAFGSSLSGGGGAGAGGFGAGGAGAGGFGQGGGAGGFGQGGAAGGSGAGGSGFGGAINQQNQGFIGRNTDANSFIGRSAQGQMNGQGNTGRQGGRQGGGGNRSLDQGLLSQLNGGQNGGNGGSQQQAPIRPRLKAAFDYPAANVGSVVSTAQVRFGKLSARFPQLDQVQVTQADNGTVRLTGSVGSRDTAKLAESLLRLEPGVRNVQNDLEFPPPAPE